MRQILGNVGPVFPTDADKPILYKAVEGPLNGHTAGLKPLLNLAPCRKPVTRLEAAFQDGLAKKLNDGVLLDWRPCLALHWFALAFAETEA
jgi:hypothetical protein